jgi:cation diffusion facilitator CzcD-associated flavoprotein CzcO
VNATNGKGRELSVGIVGAGFGGVGIGIKLAKQGIADFTIFERGETVGGVWRANTYPGAACDVPSHLYSFSFAKGSEWSRRYAPQPDILRYLKGVSDRFELGPHLRFGTEVTKASFDSDAGRWTLETDTGESHSFDVLVTACGQLTRPAMPPVEGLEDFAGPSFHSAEWDHDIDLEGKNVAVIGTGASAIQFIPAIAPSAKQLTIYQRSAPWIMPKSDRAYPKWEQQLFKAFPPRVALSRVGFFAFLEGATYGFTGTDWVIQPFKFAADRERNKVLQDPELRAKATPDYRIGCKRVLFTSDWYPTLNRPNVELLNGQVDRISKDGVIGPDGVERPADVIIFGTGFQSHRFVAPMEVHGLGDRELNAVWGDRAEAYLGTTVTGFPNMFVLYGPNTNHGSGSVPYTLECQFNYILDAVRHLQTPGFRWLDVRPETQMAWREEMEERSENTVWKSGGCHNWYLNEKGQNTNNWPGAWLEYRRRTRRINPGDYRVAVAS